MKLSLDNFIQDTKMLNQLILKLLNYAKCKTDGIEITINKNFGINLNVRHGKLENIEFNNNNISYITIYYKNRKSIVSSTNLNYSSMINIIDHGINIAKYSSLDKDCFMVDRSLLAFNFKEIDLFFPFCFDINKALNFAINSEISALNYSSKIINTEGSSFSSNISCFLFGNSNYMIGNYYSSMHSISTSVISKSKKGMERDYDYTISRDILDLKSPEDVGKESARKALLKLSPCKIKTTKLPVIFSSDISYSLFSHLAESIDGNKVYLKSTFLLNDFDTQIFPSWLNILEEPHINKGLGSKPFDKEGVRTQPNNIVLNGFIRTLLLNNYSANKLNLKSTGHSSGIHNWLISTCKITFKQLLKKMHKGLLISELMGQGVNYMTGDYSRGASGFFIENGVIKHPVKEITIAGNLKFIWRNIISISNNDININHKIRCGSILLSSLNISGY
ncbi:Metalloprotease PmbA [Buchnera aphidicola (Neophyllaphis podocarpi)]|uniref:metalloprotease PmbA n=1 Tax=Buchnera aphidicola TaxID=9 RepID=UPI003463A948